MFEDSPTTDAARARTGDARTLQAYHVFFTLHCLGFLGMLWARDASGSLRALVESFALPATADAAPAAPWQLLAYAFVHEHPLEVTVSVALLLLLGAQIERSLGTVRFSLLYLGTIAAVGLGHEGLRAIAGEASGHGQVLFVGGLGASAGLLCAYALLHPTRKAFGILPAPVFFCGTAAFIYMTANYLDHEWERKTIELLQSPSVTTEQWLERQWEQGARRFVALPHVLGFLAGSGAFAVDFVGSRAVARARVRRQIRILEEQLEARARVEQLLEKISREGLTALSRRERSFLKYASRFYPTGDRVTSEGPF